MKKLVSVALIAALLLSLCVPALADTTMYVYTENHKGLNVRETEHVTKDNIIGSLPYGSRVTVRLISSAGWAEIIYPHGENGGVYKDYAYVQARYLVKSMPKTEDDTKEDAGADAIKAIAAMNAQFNTGKAVKQPYTVYVRPTRATGWVNLRWAPSTAASVITKCRQGKELTVMAELKHWYQVQDPSTGLIGFIYRQYVAEK